MSKQFQTEVEQTEAPVPTQQKQFRYSNKLHHLRQLLHDDWLGQKYFLFGILLFLITTTLTTVYYVDYPRPEIIADTPAYLHVADRIQTYAYQLVDPGRLPGYPLLIVFGYLIGGQGNLMVVSILQAALFVLATLEIYILTNLLFRKVWLAFLIGLLVGTNFVLLAYVKPIMSEGMALWALTTVALAVVYFIRTLRVRNFWLMVLSFFPLLFTRPEWVYLPLVLFSYLLLVAFRRKSIRKILSHVVMGLALLYSFIGIYIGVNTLVNRYPGLTAVENYNLLGKVLQYNMQDEAPPEYQAISKQLDHYIVVIDIDPYHVMPYIPSLQQDHAQGAGAFARSIILRHPLEFLAKSVPWFFSSLTDYYDSPRPNIAGPYDGFVLAVKSLHRVLYHMNILLPVCAAFWLFLLFWDKAKYANTVLQMGVIVLLVLYGLSITTLGGYRADDYMRFHIVFDPLIIIIVWGSLLFALGFLVRLLSTFLTPLTQRRHF